MLPFPLPSQPARNRNRLPGLTPVKATPMPLTRAVLASFAHPGRLEPAMTALAIDAARQTLGIPGVLR